MDLVNIGYVINANGLKQANTEIDQLLNKVASLDGKKITLDTKKATEAQKNTANEVDKTSKALEKQRLVGEYLGRGLDKSTANTLASFKQLGASTKDLDAMFTLLGDNKGIVSLRKQTEDAEKARQKMFSQVQRDYTTIIDKEREKEKTISAIQEQSRKNKYKAEQDYYQKQMSLMRSNQEAEETARQKKYKDAQDYYQKQMSMVRKDAETEEAERQKKYKAAQEYYQKQMSLAQADENAVEAARQRKYAAEQSYYQKQMALVEQEKQSVLKAQQSMESEETKRLDRVASLRQQRSEQHIQTLKREQDRIRQENLKTQYLSQGYSRTQAGQLAAFSMTTTNPKQLQDYKRAIDEVRASMDSLAPSTQKATAAQNGFLSSGVLGIAKYAILSAAVYGVITSITSLITATVALADEYTAIQNRMKLYVKDAETLKVVNADLARMSVENNVGLRETATLYSRLAPSMQKFGADSKQITAVVDAFGKSMRIGGATAMEAASATIQFSQAMAAGKLQGDEFRSISEASPRFLKAIADGAGIAADNLKKMSSEGALTTELITKALIKEYPKLIEENMKLGMTLEQGVNAIKTGFGSMVGQFNEGAKLTESVGTSFAKMATMFFNAAEGATQAGSNFRETLSTIGTVLKGLGVALGVVAIAMTSKFIVGLVQGVVGMVQYNRQLLTMIATTQQSSTSTVLWSVAIDKATQSLVRLRAASGAAMSAMGGWAGIALTLVGVAAAYLMTRDNAEAVNSKLSEQANVVYRTAEEWSKLNAEQRKNEEFKLTTNATDASKQVEKLHNEYVKLFEMITTSYGMSKTPEALALIEKVKEGTLSYASALREAQKLDLVKSRDISRLMELQGTYNTAAESLNKIRESGKNAGIEIKDVGNKAQNAEISVSSMDSAMVSLGFSSEETARKLQDVKRSFIDMASDIQSSLDLQIRLGIDQGIADKAVKSVNEITAASTARIDSGNKMIADQQRVYDGLKDKEAGYAKDLLDSIDKNKKMVASNMQVIAANKRQYLDSMSPELKELQAMQDKQSAYTKSLKPQKAPKAPKKTPTEKASAQFTKQLAEMYEYNRLLALGYEIEVAKIAAQEKYGLVYGQNYETAKKLVELSRDGAMLEAFTNLNKRAADSAKVIQLVARGFTKEVAEQTVSLGFKVDETGIQYAKEVMAQSMSDLIYDTAILESEQRKINTALEQGVSLEQAKYLAVYGQKSVLTEQQQIARQTALEALHEYEVAQARTGLLREVNKLNYESLIYAQNYSEQMTQILIANKDMYHSDLNRLDAAQTMNDILKEHSAEMEKQKSFAGILESVDFSVFDSLGDPFKAALTSLDEMVFGVDKLGEKYTKVYENLKTDMETHANDETKIANLKSQYASVQASEQRELANMRDKGITNALSFTKSLFKEESKGYKNIAKLEKLYQAGRVAFALWEKREVITSTALKLANKAKEIVMGQAANAVAGVAAVLEQAKGDPYTAFARMAAMVAVVAGLGVAISGAIHSGNVGSYISSENKGVGTVFGDTEKGSESLSRSMDVLKDNSDKMLPLTNSMLRSLRSIENNMLGVANLVIRGASGGTNLADQVVQGFEYSSLGKAIYNVSNNPLLGGLSGFATGNMLANGVAMMLGTGVITGIASMALPVIGTLLGAAFGSTIGKLTSKLFGSKKTVEGGGLYGVDQNLANVLDQGFYLQEYVDIEKKKRKLFSKTVEHYTQTQQAEQEISNQFTLIFKGMYDGITSAAKVFGDDTLRDVEKRLSNYVISIGKINLKDKTGEEIQQILANVFGAEADKMAKYAIPFLKDFQKVGEGYFETLVRVATGIEKATYMTEWLNVEMIKWQDIVEAQGDVTAEIIRQSVTLAYTGKVVSGGFVDMINAFDGTGDEMFEFVKTLRHLQDAIIATGKDGDYLTNSMILGAGGVDRLSAGLNAYYEMLSPAEQAAELTRRLTREFAAYGQELPVGVKGYRDLINSIDISTEAGQKLYGQLISLAPEFNTLESALEKANGEVNKLAQSLRDLAEQARANRGATESPRNLEYLRLEYERSVALAETGDKEAIDRMLSLGKDLMNVSKMYSKTYEDYVRDLALIQTTAEGVASTLESGDTKPLDLISDSPTTPELSESGTGGTSSINTTAKETEQQIAQMREDMVIAMTTVAKYIQRLDDKFDRWDDGIAMNIRPVQDPLDAPIKVQTV